MKHGDQHKLKELCNWFNSLKSNTQIEVINFITEKTEDLNIPESDQENLNLMISEIVSFIVDSEVTDPVTISKFLRNNGLEKISSDALTEFCTNIAMPRIDALTIARMKKENLHNTTLFVLHRMILYHDYNETPFAHLLEKTGFSEDELAFRAIRFIQNNIIKVARRDISPSTLARKLCDDYGIPHELANEMVRPIEENISEIHQAYMQHQINELINIFSSFVSEIKD